MRHYPALEVTWPIRPDDDQIQRLLADLDSHAPTAVEDLAEGVRVFFLTASARDGAFRAVVAADPSAACAPVEISDEDWAARSQASLGPVTVGRLVIAPPEKDDAEGLFSADAVVLTIARSMGFGTGHHASTRLCLNLLQRMDVTGATVLDVGTGSGVLGLAAWRLGAARVVAIDSDPDALTSARENRDRNGATTGVLLKELDIATGAAELAAEPFDLLFANLTGGLLVRLAGTLTELVAPWARLILSGVMHAEADEVIAAFAARGWAVVERADEDEWVGLLLATSPTASTAS